MIIAAVGLLAIVVGGGALAFALALWVGRAVDLDPFGSMLLGWLCSTIAMVSLTAWVAPLATQI